MPATHPTGRVAGLSLPKAPRLDAFGVAGLEEDLRRGKRRLPPAGWTDPDLAMPGGRDPPEGCGDFFTRYCATDMSHTNQGRGKRGIHECATRNCRMCARSRRNDPDDEPTVERIVKMSAARPDDEPEDPQYPKVGAWMTKTVRDKLARVDYSLRVELRRSLPYGNGRKDSEGHRMDLRTPMIVHSIVSGPQRPWGQSRSEHSELQRRVVKILRERGIPGFALVAHAFRHDGTDVTGPEAYNKLGLHWHALGVSRWVMLGPPKRPARGRPPKAKDEAATLHAFDGKQWGALRSQRVPLEDWVWKVVWFAKPTHNGFNITNLERHKTYVKTGAEFAGYMRRFVEYLFHHATFYNGHYHPEDDPLSRDKVRFVRTPGRYATPSSMAYGAFRAQPKDPDDAKVWEEVQAVWGAPKPTCEVCGSPMVEVFDDPNSPAARLLARMHAVY